MSSSDVFARLREWQVVPQTDHSYSVVDVTGCDIVRVAPKGAWYFHSFLALGSEESARRTAQLIAAAPTMWFLLLQAQEAINALRCCIDDPEETEDIPDLAAAVQAEIEACTASLSIRPLAAAEE